MIEREDRGVGKAIAKMSIGESLDNASDGFDPTTHIQSIQFKLRCYEASGEDFQRLFEDSYLLKEKLKTGKCILILDALDEVTREHRNRLKDKLNRFVQTYPCQIICTSRIVVMMALL